MTGFVLCAKPLDRRIDLSKTDTPLPPAETGEDDLVPDGLNVFPTIKGYEAAHRVCVDQFQVPITQRAVREAWKSRRLASFKIGNACYFSEADIWRWLKSQRRSAVVR
ncbi:hypothetical protein [Mycolicibacterium stellerae]|uniref:hypothetical protein n=1 Tax=Mycolicibacterium stellerae TaxID=2358193 RepID=UPI0013DE3866|nr:hypothetical protein [Mycolicibacterium stellerae]